jgi:hypothetical protein
MGIPAFSAEMSVDATVDAPRVGWSGVQGGLGRDHAAPQVVAAIAPEGAPGARRMHGRLPLRGPHAGGLQKPL